MVKKIKKNGLIKEIYFFDDLKNISISNNINETELIYKNYNGMSKMRIIPRNFFEVLKNDEAIIIKPNVIK